jgi:hypothetical protein
MYPSDQDYSFREVIEHEIGHWFGLLHPDSTVGGMKCPNNFNLCADSIEGYWMLMGAGQVRPGIKPHSLNEDDKCMFEKIYCPSKVFGAVEQIPASKLPSPEVFPNPTTGTSQIQYEVPERAFVQIAIYDLRGNVVRLVSSNYEEAGSHLLSLGTEALTSGNYVCRIRVAEYVWYLNLAIVK